MFVTNIDFLTLKRNDNDLTIEDEGFKINKVKSFESTPPDLNGVVNILFTVNSIETEKYEKPTLCFAKISYTKDGAYRFDGMSAKYMNEEQNTYSFEISSQLPFENVYRTIGKLFFIRDFESLSNIDDPFEFINSNRQNQILELNIPSCHFEGGLLSDD